MNRRTKRTAAPLLALLTLLALAACGGAPAPATSPATASPEARRPSHTAASERETRAGGPENFTGEVAVSMLFAPNGPRDFSGAYVTFQPGARTAWHSHPAGQTLVVTEGMGWMQMEGSDRAELRPGDVVWTPPGVRHWHGATDTTAMTHLAVQSQLDDAVVDWGEHVSDADYLGREERR